MNRLTLTLGCLFVMAGAAPLNAETPATIVRAFLSEVRTGKDPDSAHKYFTPKVLAHQLTSEGVTTLVRTPDDYAAHVRDFRRLFGEFRFQVEELIADGDKVFVRWRQEGCHCAPIAGEKPTGKPLIEITSVVYRVRGSRIVEYWLQTDRKGLEVQIADRQTTPSGGPSR